MKSHRAPGWSPRFDITTIPDDVLLRESARRLRARQLNSPRAKVLRQCPKCGNSSAPVNYAGICPSVYSLP